MSHKHPSLNCYKKHKCKCFECRVLVSNYMRDYRGRKEMAQKTPRRVRPRLCRVCGVELWWSGEQWKDALLKQKCKDGIHKPFNTVRKN